MESPRRTTLLCWKRAVGRDRRVPLACCGSALRAAFLLLVLLAAARVAPAQVRGGVQPDVQVVVLPHPSGQWAISITYPRVVSKPFMQAHVRRLLTVSGWKGGAVEYESRGIRYNDGKRRDRPGPVGPLMSSATFVTSSAVVDWQNGTLPVEPFARAFRDLKLVYVMFSVPGEFRFRGLRQHSDSNLTVDLTAQEGIYFYALTIKNHNLGKLRLPRFQVVQPPESVRSAGATGEGQEGQARRKLVGTGLVVLLAAGAGFFVYAWAHRWGGR